MEKKVVELLEDIKKLLVLDLINKGMQGKNIAAVLGVDPAVISRIVPSRKLKKSR